MQDLIDRRLRGIDMVRLIRSASSKNLALRRGPAPRLARRRFGIINVLPIVPQLIYPTSVSLDITFVSPGQTFV
jgi:hypothetical protein